MRKHHVLALVYHNVHLALEITAVVLSAALLCKAARVHKGMKKIEEGRKEIKEGREEIFGHKPEKPEKK